ncbi:hypothetical protein IFR05_002456 [Cadophora sp. M221]|nr:hypothetical protein IFR05_002456 [Cadophora sp. M221]
MIEFVRAFVDRDLAIVVGITYWYTYAVTLAALIIGSADLLSYWNITYPLLNVTLALFLLTVFLINSRGIRLFGWIELFGGIIKVVLVSTIFVIMMCINYGSIGSAGKLGSEFFDDGVRNNPGVATTHLKAVLISIPLAIFSYIGVELVTVTAFEASDPSRLKGPTKHIAYIILAIYMISIGGFVANVEWFNQNLPHFFGQDLVIINDTDSTLGHIPRSDWHNSSRSTAAPVIAVLEVGLETLPGVLTGFLVYSGLSTANTALYVASRTLYGLTRDLSQTDRNIIVRFFAKLNTVSPTTRIPVWSLVTSCIIFSSWLPFVRFHSGYTKDEVQEVLVAVGSVGCVLVWASQCLAFIRYNKWLSIHRHELVGLHMERFQRWPQTGFSSYAASLQPIPAYIGLISCLVIVFVLNSVSMWNGDQLRLKALTVYLGPGLLTVIFIALKIWHRRGYVRLGSWEALRMTLTTLNLLIDGRGPLPTPATPPANHTHNIPFHPYQHPSPPPPPNGHLPNGNTHPYPNFPDGGAALPTLLGGIMMPPTAEQLNAMRQPNSQHLQHEISHASMDSRAHSPFTRDLEYELPVSPATEVHSEPVPASMLEGRRRSERGSDVSAYTRDELERARLRSYGPLGVRGDRI